MKIIREYKCTKCGNVQELNNKEFKECENGCYKIKLSYSGYTYKTVDGFSDCVEQVGKEKRYIEENDIVVPLTDEISGLMAEIKALNNGYESYMEPIRIWESYEKDSDGSNLLSDIHYEMYGVKNIEMTTLKLNIRFIDTIYSYSDKDIEKHRAEVPKRLKNYLDVAKKVVNNEFEITDRKYIEEHTEYEDSDKTQVELYDIEYYY